MKRTRLVLAAAAIILAIGASAATITLPRDSQASSLTQSVGLVTVRVDYSSPLVHAPNGTDRRGAIWGKLVPYGLADLGFGTCGKDCPWRAGANENTTFTTSRDIAIEGQTLPAGTYGLHMIPDPNEWTVIFSNNHTSWGSFFYDPAEDRLRVKVKPVKSEYHEALTYDFLDRHTDHATLALQWEELTIPIKITVPNSDELYVANLAHELKSEPGFQWQNIIQASQYALQHKHAAEGLKWAQVAASPASGVGIENFQTLTNLADAQELNGKTADADTTRNQAFNHPTAQPVDLHVYARQLLARKKTEDAIKVWNLNAKLHPDAWPVNVGLARANSAAHNYAEAAKYAKLALAQAPDDANKKVLEGAIKKLEAGQDMN
jgi:hypothetical protein